MSMPFRQPDGSMIRISFAPEGLSKLSSISYNYSDYDEANNANKKMIKGMDELFSLNKKYINKILNNSLFPTYYMVEFDSESEDSEPIDFVKFSNEELDLATIEKKIDLQLYNNIIFMIGNSNEFSTFFRNVWNKVIDIYNILANDNYRVLKKILNSKYEYNPKEIKEYCNDLNKYIYNFYEERIKENMVKEKCYNCYSYYKKLSSTQIPNDYYEDLKDEFNTFIIKCLDEKIDDSIESGYCINLFDDQYFAKDILELQDLNKKDVNIIKDKLFDYYYRCINVRIENNAYDDAKRCYNIVDENKEMFSSGQLEDFNKQKNIINENYDKDPVVIKRKKKLAKSKFNDSLVPITMVAILVGIISFIMAIISSFENPIWNGLLLVAIIVVVVAYFLDKVTR